MVSLYYAYFYPHLIYGIEFYGHAANCHLNQIYLLQKSALRIILKIPPGDHVTTNFKELKIMPIDMLFKYRFLIHFHKMNVNGDLELEKVPERCTRSKNIYMPKRTSSCRGDRSLLTRGVNLWNAYLMGEEAAERSEEHTSELQSLTNLVCRLLLEKKKKQHSITTLSYTIFLIKPPHNHNRA